MGRVRRRVSNNCLAGPSGAIAVASESPVRMVQWTRAVIAGAAEPGQVELLLREGIARISRLRHCHWAAMGQWSSAAPAQSGRLSPSPQASDRSATRRNADACWMRQIGSYRPIPDSGSGESKGSNMLQSCRWQNCSLAYFDPHLPAPKAATGQTGCPSGAIYW